MEYQIWVHSILNGIVQVDEDLHEDLSSVIEENELMIEDKYPSDSFLGIFWRQQRHAASLKNAKSMKWEAAMIRCALYLCINILYGRYITCLLHIHRWCLYLRHLSSSAYELLRDSGVLHLPSQRTLRDYTYYAEASTGFSLSVDKQIMDCANISSCPERERNVVIILDEMHIREDLVYDKHSGTNNFLAVVLTLIC